jgi:hypothetical protein
MASVRLQSYGLVALALMAGIGVAHAQEVQIRGTFNGVPYPPTCAPPSGGGISFVLTTPPPGQLQARFECDTVPTRPLTFTCLPGEFGGSGTGVSAQYDVRGSSGDVSVLFVECPTNAATTVVNLEAAIQDLFIDRATYQSNPGANAPETACASGVGNTITRVSYTPDTRILSYDCLSGTTTTTVECFTWDGEPVSSPRSGSGLSYQVANRNTLNVEDCIGFGANNDRALNSPALIPPQIVGSAVLFADGFEPPASVATTTTITGITPTPATIGAPYTVSVSVASDGRAPAGAVLVSDAAGANCTVTLSGTGTGSCALTSAAAGARTIRATYAGRIGFDGSTVTGAQTVGIGTQAITLGSPIEGANIVYSASGTVPLVASGGNSGNPVVFTTTTPAICGVTGSTLNIAGAGACVIRANQAGNANYTAAPQVTRNVTIVRADQTITFTQPGPDPQPFGTTFQIAATGGGSGNPVVFSSTNIERCTVAGTTVTPVAVDVCTIRAQQVGNANYNTATPVLRDITISRGVGTLAFPAQGPFPLAGGNFTLAFTSGPSTAQVTLVSLTPNICTRVSGAVFAPVAAGTCVVSATHEEDAFYFASPTLKRDITIVP